MNSKEATNSMLVDILSTILDGIVVDSPIEKIEKELYGNKRFEAQVVATAYSWIYDKMISNIDALKNGEVTTSSMRILAPEEIDVIGMDNYNRILKLMNSGLLTSNDVDKIIKSIEFLPFEKISNEDLNFIVLASLFDINKIMLPGSRLLLYLSDKVN